MGLSPTLTELAEQAGLAGRHGYICCMTAVSTTSSCLVDLSSTFAELAERAELPGKHGCISCTTAACTDSSDWGIVVEQFFVVVPWGTCQQLVGSYTWEHRQSWQFGCHLVLRGHGVIYERFERL